MKSNKSFLKRLKITKKGKILARKAGFNHFNARQSRMAQLAGRRSRPFVMKNKTKSHLLPFK